MTTITHTYSKSGFYEGVVFKLLAEMNQGKLSMNLPGLRTLEIGNGNGVHAQITVKNPDFFRRCVLYGDVGFGESYVNGDWDSPDITAVIKWFLLNVDKAPTLSGSRTQPLMLNVLKVVNKILHFSRANSLRGSKKNISEHYDLSNQFFSLFLDPSMTYSSAYFKDEGMTLEQAQIAKYERLCSQLKLKAGDSVLEIGSGWGSNAIYMAKQYDCKVTTITISREQFKLATEKVKMEGLEKNVTVLLSDYRHVKGKYDKIVSVEMLEAVGVEFYETYFSQCNRLLNRNGMLALQVITCPDSRFEQLRSGVDWIQKHVFPGSLLPSVGAINSAINKVSDLTLLDLKDIGLHYAHTLNLWYKAFNQNREEVVKLGFDDLFIRKWNYYLCYCEAAFAMRNINVMQMLYARPNNTLR